MKKRIGKQLLTALMAAVICFAIVPGKALAAPSLSTDVRIVNRSERKAKDPDASYYNISTALAGGKISIYIPVENYGAAPMTNLRCAYLVPAVVGDDCPFVIPTQDTEIAAKPAAHWAGGTAAFETSWDGASLGVNERGYFRFDATLISGLATGQQWVSFRVYFSDGSTGDGYYNDIDIWFTVGTPAEPTPEPTSAPSGGGGTSFRGKPKVIISSYSFSEEKLFAGDPFSLGLVLQNTSSTEAVKNLAVNFANEAGVVTPGSGGSNSFYVGTLEKGGTYRCVIPLQIAPDADAKAQLLDFEITYDGTKNRQEFTTKSSVTVSIQQKIRVRCDTPVVYDEAVVGGSVNLSVQMFNLGKSTLYNCMVEIDGKGLSLEESYFGGNIASGGTMRADLVVNTAEAGEVDAIARITYEDVYGDPFTEELPFHLSVASEMPMIFATGGDAEMVPAEGEAKTGLPWYIWAIAASAAVVLVILLVLKGKQRRARELEDL